jgi:Kelch motif
LAPLGTARSGHAAVVAGGRLVVLGGEELGGGTTIEQVELYDGKRDRWRALPDMVTPRHGLGAAARGSRIYALEGGPQPGLAFSRTLEFLDLR